MIKSLSICIPTYNRALYLKRCLESLKNQNIFQIDYEIIIINDGGNDRTEEIVSKFKNKLQIKYYYQSNQGRCGALRKAILIASKKYTILMDDDCFFSNDFFYTIKNIKLPSNYQSYAGFVFLRGDENKQLIGNYFKSDYLYSDLISIRKKFKKIGEMTEIVESKILKSYIYPSFSNEKRISTGSLWIPISEEYNFYFINKIIRFTSYLNDGISKNLLINKMNSPNATIYYYEKICLSTKYNILDKIFALINIGRFYFHNGKIKFKQKNNLILIYSGLLFISFFLYIIDKIRLFLKN